MQWCGCSVQSNSTFTWYKLGRGLFGGESQKEDSRFFSVCCRQDTDELSVEEYVVRQEYSWTDFIVDVPKGLIQRLIDTFVCFKLGRLSWWAGWTSPLIIAFTESSQQVSDCHCGHLVVEMLFYTFTYFIMFQRPFRWLLTALQLMTTSDVVVYFLLGDLRCTRL